MSGAHGSRAAATPVQQETVPTASLLQRTCTCGCHHSGGGQCASCRRGAAAARLAQTAPATLPPAVEETQRRTLGDLSAIPSRPRIQAKLEVGASTDRYETEADRVADVLARGGTAPAITPLSGGGGEIARESFGTDSPDGVVGGGIESAVRRADGSGTALPETMRSDLEGRFGADLSAVRVHHGADAAHLSEQLGAKAFTHGRNVFFARGAYEPYSGHGQRLLLHELTHVLQQSGGAPAVVQRASYDEVMIYGRAVHARVEKTLRANNPDLVTEAPIPGATTKAIGLAEQGWADLYRSSDPGTVVGVRGKLLDQETGLEEKDRQLNYVPVRWVNTPMSGTAKAKVAPTVSKAGRFSGDLPQTFAVADIKPVALNYFKGAVVSIGGKLGEGTGQVANYIDGFRAFAERAYQDRARTGVTRPTITGSKLTKLTIPPGLNYANFDAQAGSAGAGALIEGGTKRIWLYEQPDLGLYAYFTLPHPYDAAALKPAIDRVFMQLKGVTGELRKPTHKSSINPDLKLQRTPQVRKGGARVQRERAKAAKPNWAAEAAAWEAMRKQWDTTHAKPFLAKEGKTLSPRIAADRALGLSSKVPGTGGVTLRKEFNAIELWSGQTGRLLGKGRFLLGGAFDRIIALYESLAKRFRGLHQKMTRIRPNAGGWRQQIINALLLAAKLGFRELLTGLYRIFANCFNGVMDRVVDEFKEDIEEAHAEELKTVHEKFDIFEREFKARVEEYFGGWEEFVEAVADVKKWLSIVADVEKAIRITIQLVSCVSPPALGCLWGLVANLAAEAALSAGVPLILDSRQFREQVVQPTVQKLLKDVAGEEIQEVMAAVLGVAGLDQYVNGPNGVAACQTGAPRLDLRAAIEQNLPPVLTDAQLKARRDAWEAANRTLLLEGIRANMRTQTGGTPTTTEIANLVDAIRRSGLGHGELRAIVDGAKDKAGHVRFDAVQSGIQAATAQPLPEPDITIHKRMPAPKSKEGIRFGPLSPIGPPAGSDKQQAPGGAGVTIPIPGT